LLTYLLHFLPRNSTILFLGTFYGAIAVPSVTRCRCRCCCHRCRGHRCAGGVRQWWRATVATAGKWQCKTARSGEWAQHCSNASCFNNSVKNSVKTCCSRYDVKWGHSGWSAVPCSYHLYMRCCIDPDGPWTLSAPGIRLNSGTSATVAVSAALVLCWFSVVCLSSCWYTYVYILVCVFFAGGITFLQLRFLKWRFVCSCCAVVVDIY